MLRQKGCCRSGTSVIIVVRRTVTNNARPFAGAATGHDRAEPVAGERRHGVGHVHDSHRRSVQKAARRIRADGIRVVLVR